MIRVFADTCFIMGLKDKKDQHHGTSKRIWRMLKKDRIVRGLEDFVISDYIIIEAFQGLQSQVDFNTAYKMYEELVKRCKIEQVTKDMIQLAIKTKLTPYLNHRTKQPPIGLVDAISLVVMDKHNISHIVSFDDGFDKIPLVKRVFDEHSLPCLL